MIALLRPVAAPQRVQRNYGGAMRFLEERAARAIKFMRALLRENPSTIQSAIPAIKGETVNQDNDSAIVRLARRDGAWLQSVRCVRFGCRLMVGTAVNSAGSARSFSKPNRL